MKKLFIITIVMLLTESYSYALNFPKFPTEGVEQKTMVVEYLYNYTVWHYKQPLYLNLTSRDKAEFDSPEGALTTLVSAMAKGDTDWVLSCFDEPSKNELETILADPAMKANVAKQWDSLYKNAKLILLNRIESEGDKLIILEYKTTKTDGTESKETLNFILENNQWKATNRYSDYPVSNFFGEDRVKFHGELE